jgi:circadian clock protein KaiB
MEHLSQGKGQVDEPDQSPAEQSEQAFALLSELNLEKYILRLYVADSNLNSVRAMHQIRKLCEERLAGRYELEVIDVYQHPERTEADQVIATPTLIKELPPPLQKLIGDLTDTEKLILCLDL